MTTDTGQQKVTKRSNNTHTLGGEHVVTEEASFHRLPLSFNVIIIATVIAVVTVRIHEYTVM